MTIVCSKCKMLFGVSLSQGEMTCTCPSCHNTISVRLESERQHQRYILQEVLTPGFLQKAQTKNSEAMVK